MKVCFVVNPAAGFGGFRKLVLNAIAHLTELGCTIKRVETSGPGEATILTQKAVDEGFEVVVAVGGDGTINEVCNGLVNTEVALAVLPAGTANVYAADVGIPIWWPLNPEAVNSAAEIVVTGQRRQIDVGRLTLENGTSRYFFMWCGIGLDAAISKARQASPTQVKRLSYVSWFVSSLMVIFDFMGTPATIKTDEGTVHRRILLAVASNGQLYGRVWRMAPEAKMDDGLLDIGLMVGHGWRETIKHGLGLTFRPHIKDPNFHLSRTSRLSLSAKHPLPVHVDGETIGTTPIEIEIVPHALKVIVPKNAPKRLFIDEVM